MSKILVIFGSKSDSRTYNEVCKLLKQANIDYSLKICSAHRSPNLLTEILKTDYDVIVAGAGMASHLPGVIASKTIRPVIGVPLSGHFGGVDALLSILQMPRGIPVLTVGVDNYVEVFKNVKQINSDYDKVNMVGDKDDKRVQQCVKILNIFNINFDYSNEINSNALNICFSDLDRGHAGYWANALVIRVPLLKYSRVADINRIKKITANGIWVGLNRVENAALAAIQILNKNKKYDEQLLQYRKELEKRIMKDNEDIQ
jgi:5-(carboxyamino)imidazole ribonucleotide mutase